MTNIRMNIGCGRTPTTGWNNYDNSIGVLLAKLPGVVSLARRLRLLDAGQYEFAEFASQANIQWADGTRRIPARPGSVDVLYTSHMLEHLTREDAVKFLRLALGALTPGGLVRIAVPDLQHHVDAYLCSGDAEAFMRNTLLGKEHAVGFVARMKLLLLGERHHQWMYDGRSLCELLTAVGFEDARVLPDGVTGIANPGPLDLAERSPESVFVEARRPRQEKAAEPR